MVIPLILGAASAALGAYGEYSAGQAEGPRWTKQASQRDPTGRTQKQYRQWAGLPMNGMGGFKNLSAADQERFLGGNWGNGGGAAPGGYQTPGIMAPAGPPAAIPGGYLPPPLASYAPAPSPGLPSIIRQAGSAGVRAVGGYLAARVLGPRRAGGELVGVRGADFYSTGGYPAGADPAGLEDLLEQTYTPDLWARRLARGIAVPAAPLKANYSVPLIDISGDIEGRIRATGGPIKKSAVILYAGSGVSSDEQALLLGGLLKGRKMTRTCEVVDEEGGDAMPTVGYVYEPPKRRRGGIHIGAKRLREFNRTTKALKALQKKIPAALRRKR